MLTYGDVGGTGVRRVGTELIGRWSTSRHGGPDASGRSLTVEIGRLWLNVERHMDGVERPDTGRVHPVDLTGASGRPKICPVKG